MKNRTRIAHSSASRSIRAATAPGLRQWYGGGQPDRIVVNGTDRNDAIDVRGDAGGVTVTSPQVGIVHSEAANDARDQRTRGHGRSRFRRPGRRRDPAHGGRSTRPVAGRSSQWAGRRGPVSPWGPAKSRAASNEAAFASQGPIA